MGQGRGYGEGQTYLGFANVTTDACNASFTTTLITASTAGKYILRTPYSAAMGERMVMPRRQVDGFDPAFRTMAPAHRVRRSHDRRPDGSSDWFEKNSAREVALAAPVSVPEMVVLVPA